jgi:hypothetical protein
MPTGSGGGAITEYSLAPVQSLDGDLPKVEPAMLRVFEVVSLGVV